MSVEFIELADKLIVGAAVGWFLLGRGCGGLLRGEIGRWGKRLSGVGSVGVG